jgi:hypothetical protein
MDYLCSPIIHIYSPASGLCNGQHRWIAAHRKNIAYGDGKKPLRMVMDHCIGQLHPIPQLLTGLIPDKKI